MDLEISERVIGAIHRAARSGVSTGRTDHPVEMGYMRRCGHFHWESGTLLFFTHDTGHHTSGWMKNPDYESCRHLSMSFRKPYPHRDPDELGNPGTVARLLRSIGSFIEPRPFDYALARAWVRALLGAGERFAWEEGPFTPEARDLGVRHWRVFVDRNGEAIIPRGEVYTRDFTAKGWRSWSDQNMARPSHVSAD